MGSESIGYWLRGHEGERNNCFSRIQLVGQNIETRQLKLILINIDININILILISLVFHLILFCIRRRNFYAIFEKL